MTIRFILLGILAMHATCKKEDDLIQKSSTDLLTQKEWILASYGYDGNKNDVIDAFEENILDCEKDNTYVFDLNGTGKHFDNTLSCGNGISEQSFTWKFIDGETALDFTSGIAKIYRLNENELIIYHDDTNASCQLTRFMTIFRHCSN